MRFIIFSVLLLATLMSWECQARIKPPETDPYSHLDDVALEILAKCYGNRTSAIGLSGDTSDYLLKSLASRNLVDVTLLTPMDRKRAHHEMTGTIPYHRLSVFVITSPLSQYGQLKSPTYEIISAILRSIWWNHQASFIIILKMEEGCRQTTEHFVSFWTMDIINVNLICNNVKSSPMPLMLTFNPYGKWAPKPWLLVASFREKRSSADWSVFVRRYRNNGKMCDQLDFDKTQNLGRSAVFVSGPSKPLKWPGFLKGTALSHFFETRIHVIYTILRVINATHKVLAPPKQRWLLQGMSPALGEITDTGFTVSYPFRYIGGTFMSNFRGHKTQLEKILGVVDGSSQVATCLTLLFTVVFFKFFVRQDFASAALNVLRTVCNTGFLHVPNSPPLQIYIATILLFTVVMQGIFQSDLATLLTTAVPRRNINSVQDLVDLGSNVYITKQDYRRYLETLKDFKGRIIEYDIRAGNSLYNYCFPFLQNDTSGVCVSFVNGILRAAELAKFLKNLNFHVSNQVFQPFPYGQCWQNDWPLDRRVNNILQRMFEADIVKPLIVIATKRSGSELEFQYDKIVLANKKINVMTLTNLRFAFVILGIGLACATAVFIGEIVVSRVSSRNRTVRIRPFK